MRKTFVSILLISIVQAFLVAQVFASSRVDRVLLEDEQSVLENLETRLIQVKTLREDLKAIEKQMRVTRKGQNIYVKIDKIAGAFVVVGLIVGTYHTHFPSGLKAMIGAYITVKGFGTGLVKLSDSEVASVLGQITEYEKRLLEIEKLSKKQITRSCSRGVNHPLCYK